MALGVEPWFAFSARVPEVAYSTAHTAAHIDRPQPLDRVARGDYADSAAFQKHAERLMEAGGVSTDGDVVDDVLDLLGGLGFEIYTPTLG